MVVPKSWSSPVNGPVGVSVVGRGDSGASGSVAGLDPAGELWW